MGVNRRKTSRAGPILALVAGALLTVPAPSHAQSLDSSMSASCVAIDGSCSALRFDLNVAGDVWVDFVRLFSSDNTKWVYSDLVKVTDKWGTELAGWTASLLSNGLQLKGTGQIGAEPIYLHVTMSTWATAADLSTGLLTYSGAGNTKEDYTGTDVTFSGTVTAAGSATVTPEPVSMVLLGSGLAGLAAVRARRRENEA